MKICRIEGIRFQSEVEGVLNEACRNSDDNSQVDFPEEPWVCRDVSLIVFNERKDFSLVANAGFIPE